MVGNKSPDQKTTYRERLRSFLYNPSVNYRDKAFVLFSVTVLAALFVAIPCGLIMHEPLTATLSTLAGALFFAVYVYHSVRKKRIKRAKVVISIILVFIFLPAMFFTNGGAEGGAPVWLLLGAIYISMILEGRFKTFMMICNAVVTAVIWLIGFGYPELVTSYSRDGNFFDAFAALIIVNSIVSGLFGLNRIVEHAHELELQNMRGEQKRVRDVYTQIAMSYVRAMEMKDEYLKGNAVMTAEYARRIALLAGKSDEICERVYYAALLHDVGILGIPDDVISRGDAPDKEYREIMRQIPLIGAGILSDITEYPWLFETALCCHEKYNGTGYPKGLKEKEIPEIARIVAVAGDYVSMITKRRDRDAWPGFMARDAFIRGEGTEYDPEFAALMVRIMDIDTNERSNEDAVKLEEEITCSKYRERISRGVPVDGSIRRISFDCSLSSDPNVTFSAPSIVLFDSYDGRTHSSAEEIESYGYMEYGEIWFDRFSVTTSALKTEEKEISEKPEGNRGYEIIVGRYDDHIKLIMRSMEHSKEVIVALPSGSRASFIGLTGENCTLTGIEEEATGEIVSSGDIPRITESVSYIDHFESDIKNVQIDRSRSATTEGVELRSRMVLSFHTMSLPLASLVWHCPYVLLYSSDDGRVGGDNYREYDLIKLDGENQGSGEYADNFFDMKRTKDFPGWEAWKEKNKRGLNCEVVLEKKGDRVILKTENLGIRIENTTVIKEEHARVYVALTGDQVALTDIRVD